MRLLLPNHNQEFDSTYLIATLVVTGPQTDRLVKVFRLDRRVNAVRAPTVADLNHEEVGETKKTHVKKEAQNTRIPSRHEILSRKYRLLPKG